MSTLLVITAAAATGAICVLLELRRSDATNRARRLLAGIMAVAALTAIGLLHMRGEQVDPSQRQQNREAYLWTEGSDGAAASIAPGELHFAMPGVARKPAAAITVPDVGYIRREFPGIRTVRVRGDGLEPFEIETLNGTNVIFDEPQIAPTTPTVSFVHAPREIALGEQLPLQGRIAGIKPEAAVTLTLTNPDGTKTQTSVSGSHDGETTFAFAAPAPQAAGQFLWRLTARSDDDAAGTLVDETIGVAVVRPTVPRVLILESAPNLETAHLQRWITELGGAVVSRTTVGKERYRFSSSGEGVRQFSAVDKELLAQFEVAVLDSSSFATLNADERQALDAAVTEQGLGLLLLVRKADPAVPEPHRIGGWELQPSVEIEPGARGRSTRVQWRGVSAPPQHPVSLGDLRLARRDGAVTLVADMQQQPVVSEVRSGRGRIALSLAVDTWRWRLQNDAAAFASYWSYLLERVAKPLGANGGRWFIETPESTPLVVDRPITLRLVTRADTPASAPAHVASHATTERATLPLAQDTTEPFAWRSTFWPRRAGWHRVQVESGEAYLDFYVHPAGSWHSLTAERRRNATRLAAANAQPTVDEAPAAAMESTRMGSARALSFVLFLLSSGYLWLERRRLV